MTTLFYQNVQQDLFNGVIDFVAQDIGCAILNGSYSFSSTDTAAAISENLVSEVVILGNRTVTSVSSQGIAYKVFDALDVKFQSIANDGYFGSLIFFTLLNGQPNRLLFNLTESDGLAKFAIGKRASLYFSNGQFKIIRISSTFVGEGGFHLLQSLADEEVTQRPTSPIIRPTEQLTASSNNLRDLTNNKKYVYTDFSLNLKPHPLTGDISRLADAGSIVQSLKNIILTNKTERPFSNITFGSNIRSLLFELAGNELENELKEEIILQIVNFEPRIFVLDVEVDTILELNQLSVKIFYQIKTIEQTEVFELFLERA